MSPSIIYNGYINVMISQTAIYFYALVLPIYVQVSGQMIHPTKNCINILIKGTPTPSS